jgi:hypothetical protein
LRNFRFEVGFIVFNRRDVGAVVELGLDAEGVEVLEGTLDLPPFGIGQRLAVFEVVGALGFDDEIVFVRIAGLKVAALEDEAEVRLVEVTDGRGDAVTLGQLEEANDLVVTLGGFGEGALDGTAVRYAVVDATIGRRLNREERLDDRQKFSERNVFARTVLAERAQHLV